MIPVKGIPEEYRGLVEEAKVAQKNAHAPYSHFPVGAALLDASGKVWYGSNVESSSYGLSMCAERIALYKALSEGVDAFQRVAIVAGGNGVASPCGACRQVLHDYASNLEVILHNPERDETIVTSLASLVPLPFDEGNLSGSRKG